MLFSAIAFRIESPELREEYFRQVGLGDPRLPDRVKALLEASREEPDFLESPATGVGATIDFEPIAERPGTQLGPYKLIQQLGEGGFGVVYLAEQQEPVRRQVALKIIRPGMDTREVITRFEAERQALALMDHPNIARVLDAGATESGRPYFVMELVRGIPITEYCDQHEMSIRERLELFVTVCQAVQHAHHKGIIHRDLKPSNILVSVSEDVPVAKVIDFGVAKATGARLVDGATVTGPGQLVGTPMYMSPEQTGAAGRMWTRAPTSIHWACCCMNCLRARRLLTRSGFGRPVTTRSARSFGSRNHPSPARGSRRSQRLRRRFPPIATRAPPSSAVRCAVSWTGS